MFESHESPLYYPLTPLFGFDMDIIVKFYTADYRIQHHGPWDPLTETYSPRNTVPREIVNALQKNGVEAVVTDFFSDDGDGEGTNAWAIGEGPFSTLLHFQGEESDTGEWSFCATKIVSPVLRYAYQSFAQIEHVLRIIRENFEVGVSPSCSLHIHIGLIYPDDNEEYVESRGFPMQTLRNLLQLLTIFRPQISTIHPPFRVSGKERQFPKDFFLRTMDSLDATVAIDSCDGLWELFKLWEHTKQPSKANSWSNPLCQISNLLSRAEYNSSDHPTRTLLFRQHHATLEYESVYHWINLLIHLVKFSHECGPAGLPLPLLLEAVEEERTRDGKFHTIEFLNAIGAVASARYYDGRLYTHESAPYLSGIEEETLPELWEYFDCGSAGLGEGKAILTPPRSSFPSPAPSDYEFISNSVHSQSDSQYTSFPNPQLDTPPDSDRSDDEPPPEDEDPMMTTQNLSIMTDTSSWSHIADVLTFSGDFEPEHMVHSGGSESSSDVDEAPEIRDLFAVRFPPDFDPSNGPIATTRQGNLACDLTHRKVQY